MNGVLERFHNGGVSMGSSHAAGVSTAGYQDGGPVQFGAGSADFTPAWRDPSMGFTPKDLLFAGAGAGGLAGAGVKSILAALARQRALREAAKLAADPIERMFEEAAKKGVLPRFRDGGAVYQQGGPVELLSGVSPGPVAMNLPPDDGAGTVPAFARRLGRAFQAGGRVQAHADVFREVEEEHGLPPGLLALLAMAESSGDPRAVSPKGAQGMFQLMPQTSKMLGVDPLDPEAAAGGAGQYLRQLADRFGGDWTKALAAWNWGPTNVARHGIKRLPDETRKLLSRTIERLTKASQADVRKAEPPEEVAAEIAPADAGKPDARVDQVLEMIFERQDG